jgi:hypothetical protein
MSDTVTPRSASAASACSRSVRDFERADGLPEMPTAVSAVRVVAFMSPMRASTSAAGRHANQPRSSAG